MLKKFLEIAIRGNVIDLAIAVIIGVPFKRIVTSLARQRSGSTMPIVNQVAERVKQAKSLARVIEN